MKKETDWWGVLAVFVAIVIPLFIAGTIAFVTAHFVIKFW